MTTILTPEIVTGFYTAIWPVYAGGKAVAIERLPKANTSPVNGLVGWDTKAGCWVVLADKSLEPKPLFHLLAHELAHVANGDLQPGKDGDIENSRAMFTGERTIPAAVNLAGWLGRKDRAETRTEETAANTWAAEFARQWWPVMEAVEQAGLQALQKIMGR